MYTLLGVPQNPSVRHKYPSILIPPSIQVIFTWLNGGPLTGSITVLYNQDYIDTKSVSASNTPII